MSFIHWVGGIFSKAGHSIKDLGERAWNAITTLYHILTNLGHSVGAAWQTFYHAASRLAGDIENLGSAVYTKLRELFTVTIPHLVEHVASEAARLAHSLVDGVRRFLTGLIHAVEKVLRAAIHKVEAWAHDAYRFLSDQLSSVVRKLGTVTDLVGKYLTDAGALVAWILTPLIHAVMHYVWANAEMIAKWFFHSAGKAALDNLDTIESILSDVI